MRGRQPVFKTSDMKSILTVFIFSIGCAGYAQTVPAAIEGDTLKVQDVGFQMTKHLRKITEKYAPTQNTKIKSKLDTTLLLSNKFNQLMSSPNTRVSQDYLNSVNSNVLILKTSYTAHDPKQAIEMLDWVKQDLSLKLAMADTALGANTVLSQTVKVKIKVNKFVDNKEVPVICQVSANSWGYKDHADAFKVLGVTNPDLEVDMIIGLYDIWIEELPLKPNGVKLPLKRSFQKIEFKKGSEPNLIQINY